MYLRVCCVEQRLCIVGGTGESKERVSRVRTRSRRMIIKNI